MKKWTGILLAALLLCGCAKAPQPTLPPTEPLPTLPPSPYTAQDYRYENGFLTCTAGETVLGVDVSSHQGVIDWQAVADAGIKFVFVRLGNRGYESGKLSMDTYARANLAGAREAGLLVGAYFFSQAISVGEAKREAAFALRVLDGFQLDLPLVYDWEYVNETVRTANVGARLLTDCTLAFCQAVENAGYDAMIYFNSYQATQLLYLDELEMYPWWLAMYDISMEFPCKADIWQYTDSGSVPGISWGADVNLMFTDFGLGQAVFGKME